MCEGSRPFIPAAGVINVQVICQQYGQRIENVYNVLSGGGVLTADLDRIVAKIETWLRNTWRTEVSNGVTVQTIIARDLSSAEGIAKEYSPSPALVGANPNTAYPANVTFCVKWSTGFAGRSRRGRTYHIGLCTNNASGQSLTAGYRTTFVANYGLLRSGLAGGGTNDKLVVVSYCANNVWRSSAQVSEITGCSIDQNLDSQRRRLTGRGE